MRLGLQCISWAGLLYSFWIINEEGTQKLSVRYYHQLLLFREGGHRRRHPTPLMVSQTEMFASVSEVLQRVNLSCESLRTRHGLSINLVRSHIVTNRGEKFWRMMLRCKLEEVSWWSEASGALFWCLMQSCLQMMGGPVSVAAHKVCGVIRFLFHVLQLLPITFFTAKLGLRWRK